MDKQNRRYLAIVNILHGAVRIFFDLYVSIYIYNLTDGDMNFVLGYVAFGAAVGVILSYIFMRFISPRNAKLFFYLGFIAVIVGTMLLLILREKVLSVVLVVRALDTLSSFAHYSVYEVTVIKSSRKHSTSSYVAGVSILSSLVGALTPALSGFIISEYSYTYVFIAMIVLSLIAIFFVRKIDFRVVKEGFNLRKFWRQALRRPRIRQAYGVMFLRRLCSTDGVLKFILPIALFLMLGSEFGVGGCESVFSVIYIILMQIIRIMNKHQVRKRFYIPAALLVLAGGITMVVNYNMVTVVTFYALVKTLMTMINTETTGMIYCVGLKEHLPSSTREHIFTFNVFLAAGQLTGVLIAYLVYNYCYGAEAFSVLIVIFMVIYVLMAGLLQKIETQA